jgi:hypothetical protein
MAPVAKRNFGRRHDHGMSGPKIDGLGKEDSDDIDDDHDSDNEMDESEPSVETTPETNQKDPVVDPRKRKRTDNANGSATSSQDIIEGDCSRKGTGNSVSLKRRELWSILLARRPRTKDPRILSSWLNEVLTVSDLNVPADANVLSGISSETDSAPTQSKVIGLGNHSGDKNNSTVVGNESEKKRGTTAEKGPPTKQRSGAKKKGGGKGKAEASKSTIRDSSAVPSSPPDGQRELLRGYNAHPNFVTKDQDGFVGSFADWRGRKKTTKKPSSSLRK